MEITPDRIRQIETVLASDAARDGLTGPRASWAWRVLNDLLDAVKAQATENDELRRVVKALYENTGVIDSGYCAVCRGHRLWVHRKGGKPKPGECENPNCLTHQIDALV